MDFLSEFVLNPEVFGAVGAITDTVNGLSKTIEEVSVAAEQFAAKLPIIIGVFLIVFVLWRIILGLVARRVTSNRGRKGGFWWGFFLSFVGIIVAAVRPKE